MNDEEFRDKEIDRFLREQYGLEATRLLMPDVDAVNYPGIIDKTKEGIVDGVEKFLSGQPTDNLYKADLHAFSFEDSTQHGIEERLKDVNLPGKHAYAKDVCETYRGHILNESKSRYHAQKDT